MSRLAIMLLTAPMALTGATTPAVAEEEVRTALVRYDDLNLSSAAGRDRLNTRVKVAVDSVCNNRPHHRPSLAERARSLKCVDDSMRDANVKMAAVFNGRAEQFAEKGGVSVSAR